MDRANVDTDQIIPKQFLKRIERTGFGQFLFFDWRFHDDGSPNPDFELNRPRVRRGEHPAGAAEFRLRLEPRARPLGLGGLRLPRAHGPQLRRHLLQQLLQERHAADPAGRGRRRRPVRPRRRASGLPADGRSGSLQRSPTTAAWRCRSRSTPSAGTACSNGLDDIGLTLGARGQDPGLRSPSRDDAGGGVSPNVACGQADGAGGSP